MTEITIDQKRTFHSLILQMGFVWEDFHTIDNPEKKSYTFLWLKDIRYYTFEVYYPREFKNGHIWISLRKGGSSFYKEETELPNLQGKFGQWLHEINKQKEFDLLTNSKTIKFSETINIISPRFETIYIEALSAEQRSMNEICGMGFRKAFEFLLIDYLLYKELITDIDEAKKITALKDFINFLSDEMVIHKLLCYTAWIGNEFCHYFRKHPEKEISDLKEMIQIIVQWIETKEKLNQLKEKSERINEGFRKL